MTEVVIANKWIGPDGRAYEGGQTAEVDAGMARDLISRGAARPAEGRPAAPVETEKK